MIHTAGRAIRRSPQPPTQESQEIVMSKTATMPKTAANDDTALGELLFHALKDIYYAEKKVYKALPKMIRAASDKRLSEALTGHREETAEQIERLEKIFGMLGKKPKAERCDAIDGILEEGEGLLEDFAKTPAGDAAIIFSCQAVEHYEITRYGSMAAFARQLGHDEVAAVLDDILAEEKDADDKLSSIAEAAANSKAA
jgi:ferritin-like metal-binding protein YciE